ncbi:MAG TPA: hypothetical protein VIT91_02225 [Chthoniobacterales bacterium]
MNATTLKAASAPAAAINVRSLEESNVTIGQKTIWVYLAVAFLLGVFRQWTIWLVGALPIGEILLMGVAAHSGIWVLLTRRLPVRPPSPRLLTFFLVCQAIAFCAYVVSDFWWQSSTNDIIRGWLRMGFLLMDIWTLALLFGASPHTFLAYQIGSCFSGLQALVMRPLFGDYWKFGFGFPVTVAVIMLSSRSFGWWGAVGSCFGMGLVHTALGFRSFGALCVLTGGLLLVRVLSPVTRKVALIVGIIGGLVIFPAFSAKLGESTEGKSNRSNIERLSMLQAAREAFIEHPLVGNGSWFSKSDVMPNFLLIRAERAMITGGSTSFNNEEAGGTAIHSQILVALAEGGFFGGLFFIVYGIGAAWAMWYCLTDAPWDWLMPLKIFLLEAALWDLFMSPFSGPVRINIAMIVAMILVFVAQARSRSTERYA